jgi:adenylate cyclase
MESHGVPGSIQISHDTYDLIRDEYVCERRGTIEVKGMGDAETYFLLARRNDVRHALPTIDATADLE